MATKKSSKSKKAETIDEKAERIQNSKETQRIVDLWAAILPSCGAEDEPTDEQLRAAAEETAKTATPAQIAHLVSVIGDEAEGIAFWLAVVSEG